MNLICIEIPPYNGVPKFTLYKIYEIFERYGDKCILDDYGEVNLLYWTTKFITLDKWRELKISKILEE